MSLRLSIFLLFFILISGALSVTLLIINKNVRSAGSERVLESLNVGHKVFSDKINSELKNLVSAAKILGKEDGLREAIFDDNQSLDITLNNFLNRISINDGADLMWLLDIDGGLISSTNKNDSIKQFPYTNILESLEEQKWSTGKILPLGEKLYEIAIVGLFIPVSAPLPNYWLVIGKELDNNYVKKLSDLTDLDVVILNKTTDIRIWAKTTQTIAPQTVTLVLQQPTRTGFYTSLNNENFLSLKILLDSDEKTPIYALLLKSEKKVKEQLKELTNLLILIGISALTISLVGAAILSNRITKPLKKLVVIAQHIGQGKHTQLNIDNKSGEISTLSNAFKKMQDDIEKRQEQIQFVAYHDSLTGLANRNAFINRISQEIKLAKESKTNSTICIFDFDRFQDINDTLGHENGDHVLVEFANRLNHWCVEGISVFRIGGDEFGVLINHSHKVHEVIKNLQRLVKKPIHIEEIDLNIRLSIGVSIYPDHGETANTLLQTAEIAMYLAKKEKRGMLFYEKDRDHHSTQRLTLIAELRSAIKSNQLSLHYQPKLDIASNTYTHVECLTRWIHPRFGFISPEEFICYAEQTGTILELTRWVMTQALDQCREWKDNGKNIKVAINISAFDLAQPQFSGQVMAMINERHLQPDDVVLEITESAVMSDTEVSLKMLKELHKNGVGLSIDDYGTGYSSMAQLKLLTVDELKIDKSFVMNLQKNSDDYFIVKSTIELGHNMGLKIVAEGVETQEGLNLLRELKCDLAQGYFLSKPLALEMFNSWLSKNENNTQKKAS